MDSNTISLKDFIELPGDSPSPFGPTPDELEQAALWGYPPPTAPFERAQYFMLRRIFQLQDRGAPREDVDHLKGLVLYYRDLPLSDRLELIDTFIHSWSNEDMWKYKPEIKEVSKLYLNEICERKIHTMTYEEAARILDPETSQEALSCWAHNQEQLRKACDEACRIAARVLRQSSNPARQV